VKFGHVPTVKMLLAAGANVNAPVPSKSILVYATLPWVSIEILKALLDAPGRDVEYGGTDDLSPLLCAAMACRSDAVELLIKAGADANRTGPGDVSPLMLAAVGGLPKLRPKSFTEHSEKCARALLGAGANGASIGADFVRA
jgi:ankyrin repeat protein